MGISVVVLGGLGFMGANFVNYLLDSNLGLKIKIIDNFSYSSDISRLRNVRGEVEIHDGDIRDLDTISSKTKNVDYVFNFAAETHNDNSLKRPLEFVETNLIGVANVLEASRLNGFHFHQVSTDEVFGDLPLGSSTRFNEDSKINPSSPYSSSKAGGDLLVSSWVRSFGIRATISNSSNNFGEGQHTEKFIPRMLSLVSSGKKPEVYGNGLNVREWIYVDDHSSAVWKIATAGRNGERYLIGSGQLYSNLEVVAFINKAFKMPADNYKFIDDRPGHDLQYASDSSKLRQELGWAPEGPSLKEWINIQAELIRSK